MVKFSRFESKLKLNLCLRMRGGVSCLVRVISRVRVSAQVGIRTSCLPLASPSRAGLGKAHIRCAHAIPRPALALARGSRGGGSWCELQIRAKTRTQEITRARKDTPRTHKCKFNFNLNPKQGSSTTEREAKSKRPHPTPSLFFGVCSPARS